MIWDVNFPGPVNFIVLNSCRYRSTFCECEFAVKNGTRKFENESGVNYKNGGVSRKGQKAIKSGKLEYSVLLYQVPYVPVVRLPWTSKLREKQPGYSTLYPYQRVSIWEIANIQTDSQLACSVHYKRFSDFFRQKETCPPKSSMGPFWGPFRNVRKP